MTKVPSFAFMKMTYPVGARYSYFFLIATDRWAIYRSYRFFDQWDVQMMDKTTLFVALNTNTTNLRDFTVIFSREVGKLGTFAFNFLNGAHNDTVLKDEIEAHPTLGVESMTYKNRMFYLGGCVKQAGVSGIRPVLIKQTLQQEILFTYTSQLAGSETEFYCIDLLEVSHN